jgi:hypothetical protein
MRPARLVLAAVLVLLGLAWVGQGLGLIGGTAMSGSTVWAAVGAALIVVAAVLATRELRRA